MRKFNISLLLCALFYLPAMATNIGGTYSGEDTLTLANSPYVVTSNITIAATAIMTIESGVEIRFQDSRYMYIYGTINATGALFTSDNADPEPGDWRFINFGPGSTDRASANFQSCQFEYGQDITISNADVIMNNCSISDFEYYGIQASGSYNPSLSMTNTPISTSSTYSDSYGLYAYGGDITLNNVDISGFNTGMILSGDNTDITISDCDISSTNFPIRYQGSANLTHTNTTFTNNTNNYIQLNGAVNNGDTLHLPYFSLPYHVPNHYTIADGGQLSIASENIIKMGANRAINVYGIFKAEANSGESIYFTTIYDDNWGGDSNGDGTVTAPAVQQWNNIAFHNSSNDAECVMTRCQLRYGGYYHTGVIVTNSASPTIEECEMQFNYYGARFNGSSSPNFNNNTIGSSSVTPIAMTLDANPTFNNNTFSFQDNQYDAIGIIGSSLLNDNTIIKRDVTGIPNVSYLLLGNVTIPNGTTLTINPGIVIKSESIYHGFHVHGKLVADATDTDPIIMTSVHDDNHGNPGDTNRNGTQTAPNNNNWEGIVFYGGSDDDSILDYCDLKYAGTRYYVPAHGYTLRSAVAVVNSDVTISNCNIINSTYGISTYYEANPTISNNQLTNITYTPFALWPTSDPNFSGTTLTNVGWTAIGLIGSTVTASGTIRRRSIAGYDNITYILLGNTTVAQGAYLDMEKGIVMKMNINTYIFVDGGFQADASPDSTIVFTSIADDNIGNPMDTNGDGNATAPAKGNWYQVNYRATSDDAFNKLNEVEFRYAQRNVTYNNAGGTISNSLFTESSQNGVYISGISDPTIDHLTIQNCNQDPIAMSLFSNPTFSNITFNATGSKAIKIIDTTLGSDATLSKRDVAGINNIAYYLDGLTINQNATFTIEPGVVLKMTNNVSFQNYGALVANGTSSEKIIFTSRYDDSAGGDSNNDGNGSGPSAGNWRGITFHSNSDGETNSLTNCEFRYCGQYGYAIDFESTGGLVDHCTFQQVNGNVFEIRGSADPVITNNELFNVSQYPVRMAMFSNPTFSGNTALNIGYMAIDIIAETLSQDDTIPQRDFGGYSNITYVMPQMTINTGTEITIPAGTVMKNGSWLINGALFVEGTASEPVVFTTLEDDGYGNPGDTRNNGQTTLPDHQNGYGGGTLFNFYDASNDTTVVEHALIRYKTVAAALYSASPTFKNCTIENSDYGFNLAGVSQPKIEDNTFHDLYRTPLNMSVLSYPAVTTNNTLTGRTWKMLKLFNETLSQDVSLPKRTFAGVNAIPYYISSYTIGSGATMTIEPGVICKMQGTLNVNKGLLAIGGSTPDSTIVFTSVKDDFYGGDSNSDGSASTTNYYDWNGIYYNSTSLAPLSQLKHVILKNSNNGIRSTSASPTVTHCSIRDNYYGAYISGSSQPVFNYCDFRDNDYYGVYNSDGTFTTDATNNWWGDVSGPEHSSNTNGVGDKVSNHVDYAPFLSGPSKPVMGDVSLNEEVQAFDASLLLQYVAGLISLDTIQQSVSDVSALGGISALDAAMILQYVVGTRAAFPAESTLRNDEPEVSDVILTMGNQTVAPGDTFSMPIFLSDVNNLLSMEIHLGYDTDLLTLENIAYEPYIEDFQSITNDTEEGNLRMILAGIDYMEGDGQMATLTFIVNENAAPGSAINLDLSHFRANESLLTDLTQGGVITVESATSINNLDKTISQLSVYPNPSRGNLNINYQLRSGTHDVKIQLMDLYGQKVSTLTSQLQNEGDYFIQWDGNAANGRAVPSGIYLLHIQVGDQVITEKVRIQK